MGRTCLVAKLFIICLFWTCHNHWSLGLYPRQLLYALMHIYSKSVHTNACNKQSDVCYLSYFHVQSTKFGNRHTAHGRYEYSYNLATSRENWAQNKKKIAAGLSLVPRPSAPRPFGKLEREKWKEGLVNGHCSGRSGRMWGIH